MLKKLGTLVVGVATVLGTIFAYLEFRKGNSDSVQSPTVTTSSTPSSPPTHTTTTTQPPPPPVPPREPLPSAGPAVVRWRGTIGLPEALDLDRVPPSRDGSGSDVGATSLYEISGTNMSAIVSWPRRAAPDRDECKARLDTYPSEFIIQGPQSKSYICVSTSEGRVARLKVGGLTSSGAYEFGIIVWNR